MSKQPENMSRRKKERGGNEFTHTLTLSLSLSNGRQTSRQAGRNDTTKKAGEGILVKIALRIIGFGEFRGDPNCLKALKLIYCAQKKCQK